MKHFTTLALILFLWVVLVIACKKSNTPEEVAQIEFKVPSNFPIPFYRFIDNKVTNAGFELGRRLFFEKALSLNRSISCGNCHQQEAAFANQGIALSVGINNCVGTRNAFPLFNLAWQQHFMWDGNVRDIELSGENALTSACEMGNTIDNMVKTVAGMPAYPEMFKSAFGSPDINKDKLFKALTQFTSMMISANSKYDKVQRNEQGVVFTADEEAGHNLFLSKCGNCHVEPLFTDESFRSNGLDLHAADDGRAIVTHNALDKGKFRIPSLRNVEVTAPYMHDGRFTSLEEVLDHYASGVKDHENLDPELKKNTLPGILISPEEKKKIIAFLKTLTDQDFLKDKRFARP